MTMAEHPRSNGDPREDELRHKLLNGEPVEFAPPSDRVESVEARAARTIPASLLQSLVEVATKTVPRRIVLAHAVITGSLDFRHVTLAGEVSITDSEFEGDVDFEFANFTQGLSITGSHFLGPASFRAVRVVGDLAAAKTSFDAGLVFDDLHVAFVLDAQSIKVEGPASCVRLDSVKDANFENATFVGNTTFDNSHFWGICKFSGAKFTKRASFDECQWEGTVYFASDEAVAVFEDEAVFTDAQIVGMAIFSGVRFKGAVEFHRTAFRRGALFDANRRGDHVVFEAATNFFSHVLKMQQCSLKQNLEVMLTSPTFKLVA